MSYSEKIKKLREEYNLTQKELADKLYVTRQAVSLWEKDKVEPSKDTLILIKELYGISIDEWLGTSEHNSNDNVIDSKKKLLINKKIILLISIILFIFGSFILSSVILSRINIIKPKGFENTIVITLKENITIKSSVTNNLVFDESQKPQIKCEIPQEFKTSDLVAGLYQNDEGDFIKFNSEYKENVNNPLLGTKFYEVYKNKGYISYIDMARMAMYVDLPKINVFSSKEEVYLAGGARIIRKHLCADQNADYYGIDGGLTLDLEKCRIHGFALHFEDNVWFIYLEDFNEYNYYISIKDPDGIGKTIDSVQNFLSSMNVGNK